MQPAPPVPGLTPTHGDLRPRSLAPVEASSGLPDARRHVDLSVPSGPSSRLLDYADTPIFSVGPLSPHEVRAFHDLIDHGIQIVICTKSKPPLWPSWNLRYPALPHIVHHDALIGHVPGALQLVVFDIDAGSPDDVERFCAAYPPLLKVPSLQSGHHHVYYRTDELVGNARFRWQGIAGDIRCLNAVPPLC